MKRILLILALALVLPGVQGQTLKSFVDRLRTAGVTINQDQTATAAIGMVPATNSVAGYRLCLFNGSDQNARGRAQSIVGRLNTGYKNINVEMTYDAPVFKVYAGACLTRVEASILLASLKTEFPEAFIVSERLPLGKIASGGAATPIEEEKSDAEKAIPLE